MMRVMGIDPGSITTGFGVLDGDAKAAAYVTSGVVRANPTLPAAIRLYHIFMSLRELLTKYQPQAMSLEQSYVAANVQSALRLGEARAVALLAAAEAGIALFEYPPARVKLAVAGDGAADKSAVQAMVRRTLKLDARVELGSDAADALALALCHFCFARMAAHDSLKRGATRIKKTRQAMVR
jgi:crossover junction endodeoxyribonuclease RuvC